MNKVRFINGLIKLLNVDTNKISDGFHTFGELYDHRIENFIALCKTIQHNRQSYPSLQKFGIGRSGPLIWKSKTHSDGSSLKDWFILGIGDKEGKQITYHLPIERWNDLSFVLTLEKAPAWDGHSATDVLERLRSL
jgi:hypothetical protein